MDCNGYSRGGKECASFSQLFQMNHFRFSREWVVAHDLNDLISPNQLKNKNEKNIDNTFQHDQESYFWRIPFSS